MKAAISTSKNRGLCGNFVAASLPQAPVPLEKDIQSAIIDYLTARRIFHWRSNTGASKYEYNGKTRFVRYGSPGVSDIIGIYQGRLLAIEVKRKGGKVSKDQEMFIKNVNDAGGIAFVAYSVDDVIDRLKVKPHA